MELKDYNLYSLFLKAVELKNYSRVAEAVGLSSHHIVSDKMKMLEQRIGVKLFVRAFRSMEPTSDAITIYNTIKPLFDKINMFEKDMGVFDDKSVATLRLSVPITIATKHLLNFFKSFTKKYPNIKLDFYPNDSTLLENNKIDFLIDKDYEVKRHGFSAFKLFENECIFFATKKYIAENNIKTNLTIEELLELKIICQRNFLRELNQEANLNIEPSITTVTSEHTLLFVKNGFGVGYYFHNIFEKLDDDFVELTVEGLKMPKTSIFCAYDKSNLTRAAHFFLKELQQFVQNIS